MTPGTALRVVICGPFPLDDEDLRHADGLLHSIVNLAHGLKRLPEGLDIHVLSRSRKVRRETDTIRLGLPVTFVPDPLTAVDYLLGRRMLIARLARALRRLRPDIVHAHGEPPFIFAALRSQVPHVVTLQGLFKDQTRPIGAKSPPLGHRVAYWKLRSWERRYIPLIRNLLAVNDTIARCVKERVPDVRTFKTTNTAAEMFFSLESTESSLVILSVSQISQRKGLHHLLEAFDRIAGDLPDCQLRIAGADVQDPVYAAALRHQYKGLIARGRVQFLGGLPHARIAEELRRCTVFCLASLYEASPLAVAEAMAGAKSVVATRVGDMEELVGATGAGVLVDPGDVAGLSEALLKVLTMPPNERAAMGHRGREVACKRAHPDVAAGDALSAYRAILGLDLPTNPVP